MKLVKHNVAENYFAFDGEERDDLLLQELSKAIITFPRAIKDVLDYCDISYKESNLQDAIQKNAANLKMLNRVVKLSLVTTLELEKSKGRIDSNKTYRDIMSDKKEYLTENQDIIKDGVLRLRSFFNNAEKKEQLGKVLNEYLNMDGQEEVFVSSIDKHPVNKSILLVSLIAIGVVVYYITKKK
jgi:hypothetical protein